VVNVLMLVVDCLRADHLGCYGYHRDTTPNIDGLSADSLVFKEAFTQSTFTMTSASSLLTGLYPEAHGVLRFNDRLPTGIPTLPRLLGERGYDSTCFSGMSFFSPPSGLDDVGFRRADFLREERLANEAGQATCEAIHSKFTEYLGNAGEPFLSLLWFFDAHGYNDGFFLPDEEMRYLGTSGNERVDRYDSEIRHVDRYIDMILEELKHRGLYDDTLIVVTSDHGEVFDEHRLIEGTSMGSALDRIPLLRGAVTRDFLGHLGVLPYDGVIRVPLIVKMPRAEMAGERHGLVELVDVFPTVLDILGVEAPAVQGRSVLPVARGEAAGKDTVFCATQPYDWTAMLTCSRSERFKIVKIFPPEVSVGNARRNLPKLVADLMASGDRLYRVGSPERVDCSRDYPGEKSSLKSKLLSWREESRRLHEERPGRGEGADLSEEDEREIERRLEALGYLG